MSIWGWLPIEVTVTNPTDNRCLPKSRVPGTSDAGEPKL